MPVYKRKEDADNEKSHSQFIQIKPNVYIHKRTGVWLFQETERVSSD